MFREKTVSSISNAPNL